MKSSSESCCCSVVSGGNARGAKTDGEEKVKREMKKKTPRISYSMLRPGEEIFVLSHWPAADLAGKVRGAPGGQRRPLRHWRAMG